MAVKNIVITDFTYYFLIQFSARDIRKVEKKDIKQIKDDGEFVSIALGSGDSVPIQNAVQIRFADVLTPALANSSALAAWFQTSMDTYSALMVVILEASAPYF